MIKQKIILIIFMMKFVFFLIFSPLLMPGMIKAIMPVGTEKGSVFALEEEMPPEEMKFPQTAAGQQAAQFFQAFIKGNKANLEKFFEACLPENRLKATPASERALKLMHLRQQLGEIIPLKIQNPSANEFVIFFKGKGNELWAINLTFEAKGNVIYLQSLTIDEAGQENLLPPIPPMPLEKRIREIDQQISQFSDQDKFSGVVLIAQHFKPVYFKAWGLANREFHVANRLDTKFNLGSINKLFTKIAIGQLVERGLIFLDDFLGKFLPDYPNTEAREKVRIRHLVEMTSGIGDFFGPDFQATPKDFIRHNRDYFRFFAAKPLAFEPGTKQMYSNGSYVVLGEIISRASGFDYYEFVKKNIFDVAGMKDSAWYEADEPVPNLAEGYTKETPDLKKAGQGKPDQFLSRENHEDNANEEGKKRETGEIKDKKTFKSELNAENQEARENKKEKSLTWRKNIYSRPARGSAAGGGYSTAEDLLRLIEALYNCQLLSPSWTDWVFGGPEPKEKSSQKQFNHNTKKWNISVAGGAPGINAALELEGERGWIIIVLANLDPPSATDISRLIKRYLFQKIN